MVETDESTETVTKKIRTTIKCGGSKDFTVKNSVSYIFYDYSLIFFPSGYYLSFCSVSSHHLSLPQTDMKTSLGKLISKYLILC